MRLPHSDIEVLRACELVEGDEIRYNGLELRVFEVNGVVSCRYKHMTGTWQKWDGRISAKSQQWVEILKKQTNEKNVKTGF